MAGMSTVADAEIIEDVRRVIGPSTLDSDILRALSLAGNDPTAAINLILDTPGFLTGPTATVKRTTAGAGTRVYTDAAQEVSEASRDNESLCCFGSIKVKEEISEVKQEVFGTRKEMDGFGGRYSIKVKKEKSEVKQEVFETEEEMGGFGGVDSIKMKAEKKSEVKKEVPEVREELGGFCSVRPIKVEEDCAPDFEVLTGLQPSIVKNDNLDARRSDFIDLENLHCSSYLNPRPISCLRPKMNMDRRMQVCSAMEPAETDEFPEEEDWFLVGGTSTVGLSTCRGRKLEFYEVVHFSFPSEEMVRKYSRHWLSSKAATARSGIVRFSTKRSGEIGRLPMEWSRCLVPLVNSSQVKVRGRCISTPADLHIMQEITLYISLYIHSSVFTEGDNSSWKLLAPSQVESTFHPLPTLFKFLKIKPFKKADFTPEDLDTRKQSLNLESDSEEGPMPSLAKRRKGNHEKDKKEQVVSESSLTKLVGASDVYNFEEMDPPSTLTCDLWPYQKQALHWMSELERGADVEKAAKTLHPCWEAYNIRDKRASAVYLNVFSGEATTEFPSATRMGRGGILADAMGLGKTIMTIALILRKPGWENPDDPEDKERKDGDDTEKDAQPITPTFKGGTLVVCPMALLGQWKDELEAHSEQGAISVLVHYGGDRTSNPTMLSKHHVVLTTYGVLTASYKNGLGKESIFHKVEWYRVVLDEAHNIKSTRSQAAQATFALNSHCRWCLTGTPLQNNLEDLYSLVCFLCVEPWCNWAWWQKLIQKPYENGDERGLKLVKAILRPLMLRRTKDSRDKEGRPIIVLPPIDIQLVECEQSEEERDFYDALFKKSKVRFDQFVSQGKVLHNYASILELLLRLRQCCNHPFLVMSRGDNQQYSDLNKLARRFLEGNPPNSTNPISSAPTRAYIEEVVDGIRRGDVIECPICLESADDPVLTPCAHQMCRDCLLSSWRNPSSGLCPICRKLLSKADLITCPSESRFHLDVEKNWKESSKVSKLLSCLKGIRRSGLGEKTIVFSQWTSFLDLLQIPLERNGIGFLRYDGKLGQKQRDMVLKEFSASRKKMVLLMSLKAGGFGLNLTAASNVFIMDPWWNPAVEEQAIMRIHRIGQKQKVRVRRFIVKGTVEDRLQLVQERKQRMIEGALTDEEVRTSRIEELKMLFR